MLRGAAIVVEFLLMELTATYVISSIMFLLFIGALFLSLLWAFWPSDIRYWVKIGSASGEEKALLCNTKDEAQTISEAINDALFDNFALKNKFNRSSWC